MDLRTYLIVCFITLAGVRLVVSQNSQISRNHLEAPSSLVAYDGPGQEAHFRTMFWSESQNAVSYVLRIYSAQNDVIFMEIRDIYFPFYNVTGLESGTDYIVTVSAVYVNEDDEEESIESPPSTPTEFTTDPVCFNGQIYNCNTECTATCSEPAPVCSKICHWGCGCPANKPIWHEGQCIALASCPPANVSPSKPNNLLLLSDENGFVVVVWDEVKNTEQYMIKVRVAESGELVQTLYSNETIETIENLEPGFQYTVAISATPELPGTPSSLTYLQAPTIFTVRDITDESFIVNWSAQTSVTYAFFLFDGNHDLILVVENLYESGVHVNSLAPGAIYYYAVAATSVGQFGTLSALQKVRTRGRIEDSFDFHAVVLAVTLEEAEDNSSSETAYMTQTMCQQRHTSVGAFYSKFSSVRNGPEFPDCDELGYFITTKCTSNESDPSCWCVNPITGKKLFGTDFGGENSAFELNCDKVGKLTAEHIALQARNLSSTSIQLDWGAIDGVRGYVLVIEHTLDGARTLSIINAATLSYQLNNLWPGNTYNIAIFAVNSQGWSSQTTSLQVQTAMLDPPQNVVMSRPSGNSVSLSWRYSARADGFQINVISSETESILRTILAVDNTITLDNLKQSRYTVEVREVICEGNCANHNAIITELSEPTIVELSFQCPQPVMDIVLAFDVTEGSDLQMQKQLADEIIQSVPPLNKQTGTRIGAITYSRHARVLFSYDRYNNNLPGMNESIQAIESDGNTESRSSLMLNYIRTRFLNFRRDEEYRKRPDTTSVIIIFSGAPTSDSFAFERTVRELQSQSTIIAVRVNARSDVGILSRMVSNSDLLINALTVSDRESFSDVLTNNFCSL